MPSITGNMPRWLPSLALFAAFIAAPAGAQTPDPNGIDTGNFTAPPGADAQQNLAHELAALGWVFGPQTIPIGTTATIAIPTGYEMLAPPDAEKFLQLNGNSLAPSDAGDYILQNEDPDSGWFAVISAESGGHIQDGGGLDQADILSTMQSVTARDKSSPSALTGWAVPPAYDPASHRLEWAFAFTMANGTRSIPLNIRLLSRLGDLKIVVVDDPNSVATDLPDVNKAIAGIAFNQSQHYTDYTQGDATAPYGLAGLVEGASAATGTLPPPPPPAQTGKFIVIGALIAVALALLGWLGWRVRK